MKKIVCVALLLICHSFTHAELDCEEPIENACCDDNKPASWTDPNTGIEWPTLTYLQQDLSTTNETRAGYPVVTSPIEIVLDNTPCENWEEERCCWDKEDGWPAPDPAPDLNCSASYTFSVGVEGEMQVGQKFGIVAEGAVGKILAEVGGELIGELSNSLAGVIGTRVEKTSSASTSVTSCSAWNIVFKYKRSKKTTIIDHVTTFRCYYGACVSEGYDTFIKPTSYSDGTCDSDSYSSTGYAYHYSGFGFELKNITPACPED